VSYERPGKVAGLYVSWHRCALDRLDHAVTDDCFLVGVRARRGQYEAVCGHVVEAASALLPPARPCVRCHAYLDALVAATVRPVRHRPHQRGFWRRLTSRPPIPAAAVGCARVPARADSDDVTTSARAAHHTQRGPR
jgi:hypothetical protein